MWKTLLCLLCLYSQPTTANPWIPDYVPVGVRIAHALPHIQVFATGGRPVVVISLRMPCEVITGTRSPPADVIRWVLNTAASLVNESSVVGFDVEIVCSGE